MKLLFFVYSLGCGGAERTTANLANHWAEKGWEVVVVTLAPQGDDFYQLHPAVGRIALDMAADSRHSAHATHQNLQRILALRRVLHSWRPEVAVGMMTTANVLLAFAAWGLANVRAIGSERVHPPALPLGAMWQLLRRVGYARLAAVSALTSESARWLENNTGNRNVMVIPNPVVWPMPGRLPHLAPQSLLETHRLVLLAVGRMELQKQFPLLMAAFASLAPSYPDWDLVILGEGSGRQEMQALSMSPALAGRVFLPGAAGNMAEWYQRASLFALSSHFEGFPNALVEAMASGLPAVSFDCETGPRDIVRHEVDGLLVPAQDVAGLAAALARLMGDAGLRRRFAQRAPDVRDRFSMPRISAMWESLFHGVRP